MGSKSARGPTKSDGTESVSSLGNALRPSPVVLYTQDLDLRYTWAFNLHPGFLARDVVGKTDIDLFPLAEATRLIEIKRSVLETGLPRREEIASIVGGENRVYDLNVKSLHDDGGQVVGLTCISIDITEEKKTQSALGRSEDRHRALINAMPDAMFRIRRDGTFLEYLPADGFPLLAPVEEMVGKNVRDVMPGPVASESTRAIGQAFDTGQVQTFEYPLEFGEDRRHFEARLVVSGPDEVLAIIRDISARRQAIDALQRRDEQLERLLEAALRLSAKHDLDPVLQEVVDSARTVMGCRYAALGILDSDGERLANFVVSGIAGEEARRIGSLPTGEGVLGLIIRAKKPIRLANLSSHEAAHGFPAAHPEMRSFLGVPVTGRDGPIGSLYLTEKIGASEFPEEDESVAGMLAAEAAVAVESARLVTELRTLQASRDQFYAMINHELRNALTGVYGWAELLVRKSGNEPPRAATETLESAEHALELLNDLLDLSRLDAEGIEPAVRRLDAREILNDAVMTVEPSAAEEGVAIVVSGLDDPMPCTTDGRRVRQVVINLLRNAIRHSASRDVLVNLDGDASTLRIVVTDHGKGISPEQLAIIFDAYKRADSLAGGGTGLGLTLSRRLARLLDGDITVESKEGKGATFTFEVARHLQ